jgi:hypothetical protein
MKKFENKEAAFASQNYDPSKVKIEGVPEQHLAAVQAFINLCVVHDAVNPEFAPNHGDWDQDKYTAVHTEDDASGGGFRFLFADGWNAYSSCGSRLESESRSAANHIAEICHEDYAAMKIYERKVIKN